MTTTLRRLVWAAVLVGWVVLVLDLRDEVVRLRPERVRLEQLRAKEQSALWNVDWKGALNEANSAQAQWLTRLPRIEQIGVFRAQTMESMSDLCKQIDASCQIGALGETTKTGSNAVGSNDKPGGANGLPDIVVSAVRVSLPVQGDKLELLMKTLENDSQLRRIDKVIVRAGRATLDVQSFGLDARIASAKESPP
jgi:hypothetical protein